MQVIPKSKIKSRKKKKKQKVEESKLTSNLSSSKNLLPIALQKFSFVNTTEQSQLDIVRANSGAVMRADSGAILRADSGALVRENSGPLGMTATSGGLGNKFFGEATLSNLGK